MTSADRELSRYTRILRIIRIGKLYKATQIVHIITEENQYSSKNNSSGAAVARTTAGYS